MIKSNTLTNRFTVSILAIICCILWGSAFPSIKIGYELLHISSSAVGSQILFAGMRFTLAGILTILFGSIINRRLLIPKRNSFPLIFKLSLVQTMAQYIFFYIGLANTTGVKASIITACNVFLALLIPSLILKQEKLTCFKIIGCLIGFAGVILINLSSGSIDTIIKWNGEGFMFLSAFSYALSSIMIKKYSLQENPVILSGYQFFAGGILLIICGFFRHGRIGMMSPAAFSLFFYLAFVSAAAYTLWAILLKYNPVGKVAIYGFMNPVCGVILSTLLLKENGQTFGIFSLISLLLVCIGIFLVNKSE